MCKNSQPQTTSQTNAPPPQVLADYQSLVNRGTSNANVPYTPYQGEQVAPLTPQTTSGIGNINEYAFSGQPAYQNASNMTQGAVSGANPWFSTAQGMTQNAAQAPNAATIGQYMNPFTNSVVNATQAEFNNQNQQQSQFLNSANISSGNSPFAGDRAGIAQAVLANQQNLAQAPVIAGLNQANYSQALGEANTQQQAQFQGATELGNLGLAQANLGLQGAGQIGNLGTAAQTAGLQGATAQTQAGMIPQQEQQALDSALMAQYAQSQAYPFQTTGWLGNLIEGLGSQSGGQSTTNAPAPSTTSQAIGAGVAGLGLLGSFLSDIRIKEDVKPVGKTFDGQTIYRFRYEGDPRTQIGLIAQDVEKSHPGAVHRAGLGSLRAVNYKDATDASARRGHFQYGGPTGPSYTGPPRPGTGAPVTPQAALAMLGSRGAMIGLNPTTVAANAYTPQGLLARQGFQGGGVSYPASPDAFIDFSSPTAIASGVGAPTPLSGVAALEYWAATQGGSGVAGGAGAGSNSGGTLTPESPTPSPVVGWNPSTYQGYTNPSYAGGNPVVPNFSPFANNTYGGVTSGTPGTAFQTSQPQGGVNPHAGTTLAGLTGGSVTNPSATPAASPAAVPAASAAPTSFAARAPSGEPVAIPYYNEVRGGMLNQTGQIYVTPQNAALNGYAAGGMIGQSGLHHAMGYVPQGHGLTGMDSQGQGLGTIGQFGGMFGSREGFASGGSSADQQPWNTVVSWVPNVGPLAIGPGPPHPGFPNQNNQPQPGILGQNPLQTGKDIGGSLSKVASAAQNSGIFGSNQDSLAAFGSDALSASDIGASLSDAALGSALADLASGGMVKRRKRRKGGRLGRDNGGGTGDGVGDGSSAAAAAADAAAAAAGYGSGSGIGNADATGVTGYGQSLGFGAEAAGFGYGQPGYGQAGDFGNNTTATLGADTSGTSFGHQGVNAAVGQSQGFGPGPGSAVANAAAASLGLGGSNPGGDNGLGGGASGYGVLGGIGNAAPSGHVAVSPINNALAALAAKGVNVGNLNSAQLGQLIAGLHSGVGGTSDIGGQTGATPGLGSVFGAQTGTPAAGPSAQGYPPGVVSQLNAQLAQLANQGVNVGNMDSAQLGQVIAGLHSGVGPTAASPAGFTGSVTAAAPSALGQVAPAAPAMHGAASTASPAPSSVATALALGRNSNGQPFVGTNNRGQPSAPESRFSSGGRARFDDGGVATPPDSPNAPPPGPTRQQVLAYAHQAASDRGIDPNVAANFITHEMGATPYQPGDGGSSFNPMQMHMGGINPDMPHAGMGDDYQAATGHSPNDPRYWQEQINYGLDAAKKSGWGPWQTTMNKLGYNQWSGISGAPANSNVMGNNGGQGFFGMRAQAAPDQPLDPDKHIGPITIPGALPGALMSAGFGMMAGRSPYAMVNIGQGGQQGMEYYQKQQQLERESGLSQAEIRHYDAETQQALVNMNLELAALKGGGMGSPPVDLSGKGYGVAPAMTPGAPAATALGKTTGTSIAAPAVAGNLGQAAAINTAGVPPANVGPPPMAPQVASNATRPAPPLPPAGVAALRNALPNVPASGAQPTQATAPQPTTAPPGQVPPRTASSVIGYDPITGQPWASDDPHWKAWQVDNTKNPYAYRDLAQWEQQQARSPYAMLNPRWGNMMDTQAQTNIARANALDDQYSAVMRERAAEAARQSQTQRTFETPEGGEVYGTTANPPIGVGSAGVPLPAKNPAYVTQQQAALWKEHNEMPQEMQQRAQTGERLDRLINLMNGGYETGAFNEFKAGAVADLRALGLNVPSSATANPEAFQVFMKEHQQLVMNQVKQMGNRPLVTEIKTFQMGNPGPELQPKANAMMLTEMKGILNWQNQYSNDFLNWHSQNPGAYDEGQFASNWLANNPIEKYISPEALKFAYKGQYVPPTATDRLNGQHYMTQKMGEMVWSGKDGWLTPAEAQQRGMQ